MTTPKHEKQQAIQEAAEDMPNPWLRMLEGDHTKRTPELIRNVLLALQDGKSMRQAAEAVNLNPVTLYRWANDNEDFRSAMQVARRTHGADWFEARVWDAASGDPSMTKINPAWVAMGLKLRGRLMDKPPTVNVSIDNRRIEAEAMAVQRFREHMEREAALGDGHPRHA